jgi:putative hydrolase of the HAD superfamily
MAERGLTDPDHYFAFVHPADEADTLMPDRALETFLKSLPCPLAILTNSPREHAERILAKLGIAGLFTHLFDIRQNNLQGKPRPEAYNGALAALGTTPETTLYIDDYPKYIKGYLALGGRGLLLDENDRFSEYEHDRIRTLTELTAYL